MLLTRLLAPEAFGVMAIIMAVNSFLESFTDVGINTAIVQNPRSDEPTYLNGSFWISLARGTGLYLLILIAAPWTAGFYHQQAMAALMRVAFLEILLKGAFSPRLYIAQKKMDFKRLLLVSQGAGICGSVATIVLAFSLRSVWALVLGIVVEYVTRCTFSYLACPFRPGFDFDREGLRALYRYTRGMAGLPVLTFIFMRADVFVLGRVRSPADVGIYSMAAVLALVPYSFLAGFLTQLLNPAFSEMQSEPERLRRTLFQVTSLATVLVVPATLFVALYGKHLLRFLYGGPYAKAAVPFAILFATAMLRLLTVPVVSLYFMIGRPGLNRYFAIARTALIVLLIYPAIRWHGLTGAALAGLVAMAAGYALQLVRLRSIIGLDLVPYLKVVGRALPLSLPLLAMWITTHHTVRLIPAFHLGIGIAGCLIGYALALIFRWRPLLRPQI